MIKLKNNNAVQKQICCMLKNLLKTIEIMHSISDKIYIGQLNSICI